MSDGRIDWPKLLIGRTCPPPGWWVGLAIERKVGTVELRASAVVALLALPLRLDPGQMPYLAHLPRLAKEWITLCRQHDTFICLGPDSDAMNTAVTILLTAEAACSAMDGGPPKGQASAKPQHYDPKANALVPELWEFYAEAAGLVRALEAAGIPLASCQNRLSGAARAALQQEVAEINARRDRRAEEPLDPTDAAPAAAPAPARQRRGKPPKPPAAAAAVITTWLE